MCGAMRILKNITYEVKESHSQIRRRKPSGGITDTALKLGINLNADGTCTLKDQKLAAGKQKKNSYV